MEASITMQFLIDRARSPRWRLALAFAAATAIVPSTASAQGRNPEMGPSAVGERYHIEVGGTLWNPALFGVISSEQFGQIGSDIDFTDDLNFKQTRFKDLRIVLRPAKKHRFRLQYTPVVYTSETQFRRDIIFNNQRFPVSVPVNSEFGWKVWRVGYEYDFLYKPRGFVGILFEGRVTEFSARLATPFADPEFVLARAPLPAIGLVGRAYVLPEVALNFEVSGLKLPDVDPDYQANYFDWDVNGTVNLTNNVGLQVGWRRMTTFLAIERDKGDVKFEGMWFGAAIRN
jgi:hypothetical protein